jgi:serine/threonine-protein kinase
MLAGRYRIVALLGRGGMGEVYRAEDVRLGVSVALKFLPDASADRLERFYDEVRLGRQVAHANVCRIFDVGETEGQHFLSMEYVDGEDLASLLRRIGRLPVDKAVEVLRDVCAGLEAAHGLGIVHRDLKPANILIDGRGRARIADFGLAALAERTGHGLAGTPAYMAPEQIQGREASARSDLYALGLIGYEALTGTRLFDATTLPAIRDQHERRGPLTLRGQVPGLEARTERVLLQCLDEDPAARPASARQVLVALPGGDPLQAAIEAGETPSPQMVAAARSVGDLSTARAWAALAAVIIGVLVAVPLAGRTLLYRKVAVKPPDALVDKAREILGAAGENATARDWAGRYTWSTQYFRHLARHDPSSRRDERFARPGRHTVLFSYRQSPDALDPNGGFVDSTDPPFDVPGMALVEVGMDGLLDQYAVVPPEFDDAAGRFPAPDWTALLRAAGLDSAALEPVPSQWAAPVGTDARAAWIVRGADPLDRPVRVEAGSYHGRPVYMKMLWAWDRPEPGAPDRPTPFAWLLRIGFFPAANAVALLVALVLALRNVRLGRGDRSGASKVALAYFFLEVAGRLLAAHHPPRAGAEWALIEHHLAMALFHAAKMWLLYVALEPYARRRWPHTLVSWTRLLAGRGRDPHVGRDLLLGAAAGTAMFAAWQLARMAPTWAGEQVIPFGRVMPLTARAFAASVANTAAEALEAALLNLFLLVFYRIVFRKDLLAVAFLIWNAFVFNQWLAPGRSVVPALPFLVAMAAIPVLVQVRVGLLALASTVFFFAGMRSLPITFDMSAPYAGESLVVMALFAAFAVFAFHTALGGKPLFGRALEA